MTPSLGVVIGLPVAGLLVLIALCVLAFGIYVQIVEGDAGFFIGLGAAALVIVVVATGAFMWPWSAEYHEWRPVSGTVTATASRLLGENKSTTQYYAMQIAGQDYRCDDTRCATVKVGDHLDMTCKREWQFTGTPGWDCNFVATTPASGRSGS